MEEIVSEQRMVMAQTRVVNLKKHGLNSERMYQTGITGTTYEKLDGADRRKRVGRRPTRILYSRDIGIDIYRCARQWLLPTISIYPNNIMVINSTEHKPWPRQLSISISLLSVIDVQYNLIHPCSLPCNKSRHRVK